MSWLRILGEPVRVFHDATVDRADLAGQGSPHELLSTVGKLASGIDGETPNLSVELLNTSGQCARLFATPPLGATAELRDSTGVLFAGTVQSLALDADKCTLGIETLLTRPLPLRLSTIWGGFREAVPLPQRYGECSGELIQYNAARTIFCWADHACQSIDTVFVGDQVAGEWQWTTLVDASNHVITVVEFGQPIDEGATVTARGRGKLHPVTGQLMENPATILWDVLANIGGWAITESQIEDFRRDCDRLGYAAGGSIEQADTPQTVARAICASFGAAFCADAPGLCRLLPAVSMPAPRATVTEGEVSASADLEALCNDLTVQYGFAGGDPTGSVQLEAPDYIARHGRRTESLEAQWITSPRVAYAVCERILSDRARPRYAITVEAVRKRLAVFDAVATNHPALPANGTFLVRTREVSSIGTVTTSRITGVLAVGDAPALRLVRQAIAFEAQQYVGASVQTVGTDRIYTITEADQATPVVGASVTANGFTRQTNAAGRVAFPISALPPGSYVFHIVAADGREWDWPTVVT